MPDTERKTDPAPATDRAELEAALILMTAQAARIILDAINSGPGADLTVSGFSRGMGALLERASKVYGNELLGRIFPEATIETVEKGRIV